MVGSFDALVEKEMKPLIREVDTHLPKPIVVEVLKPENVKDSNLARGATGCVFVCWAK